MVDGGGVDAENQQTELFSPLIRGETMKVPFAQALPPSLATSTLTPGPALS